MPAAIILAGGRSTRMGEDKAFVRAGGRPVIEVQIGALKEIFQGVYISAKDTSALEGLGAEVMADVCEDSAALVGLYSALRASRAEVNFCVACDMPVIHRALIEEMLRRVEGYAAVVPESARGLEPTYAVYTKACCAGAGLLIERKEFAFRKLMEVSPALVVPRAEVSEICGGADPFININTLQDLERFRSLIERGEQ